MVYLCIINGCAFGKNEFQFVFVHEVLKCFLLRFFFSMSILKSPIKIIGKSLGTPLIWFPKLNQNILFSFLGVYKLQIHIT